MSSNPTSNAITDRKNEVLMHPVALAFLTQVTHFLRIEIKQEERILIATPVAPWVGRSMPHELTPWRVEGILHDGV